MCHDNSQISKDSGLLLCRLLDMHTAVLALFRTNAEKAAKKWDYQCFLGEELQYYRIHPHGIQLHQK